MNEISLRIKGEHESVKLCFIFFVLSVFKRCLRSVIVYFRDPTDIYDV